LTKEGIAFVGKSISTFVLEYGGIAFIVAGAFIVAFPSILNYGIVTGIKVHNLDDLNIGFFLVIIVVIVLGFIGYKRAIDRATSNPMFSHTD
ncbi:MAG: hypothetical protein QXZ12_04690, partial [Thermoplasmata archaeon]